MIEFTKGNLLNARVEALVNAVNTVGVMGKGIALQFKRAFPENFTAYAKACMQGEVVIGRMFVTKSVRAEGPLIRWDPIPQINAITDDQSARLSAALRGTVDGCGDAPIDAYGTKGVRELELLSADDGIPCATDAPKDSAANGLPIAVLDEQHVSDGNRRHTARRSDRGDDSVARDRRLILE